MDTSSLPYRHDRALTSIVYALHLQEEPSVWQGLATVLRKRLTAYERACVLTAVAAATDTDLLFDIFDAVYAERLLGRPLPILFDVHDDARWWAAFATLPELKAWTETCFLRLPKSDQNSFLITAQRRAAA